jgi:hypothetical protein
VEPEKDCWKKLLGIDLNDSTIFKNGQKRVKKTENVTVEVTNSVAA